MADGEFSLQATVQVDGKPLSEELEPLLEAVVVDDHLHLPDMFQLSLRDVDLHVLANAGIRIGCKVVVSGSRLGEANAQPLIIGEVTGIEAEYDTLGGRAVVRGYDHSHRLHRGRVTETYRNVTDSDVVRTVARRAGIELGTIDASGATHEHVSQANCSDWEFLQGRAREVGFHLAVESGKLHFRKPAQASEAPGEGDFESQSELELVMGKELLEFRPRITSSEQVSEVEVRAWNAIKKQAMVATAAASAANAKLTTDPVKLAGMFGAARTVTINEPMSSQAAVDTAAKALAERMGSAFAEANGVCRGSPKLRAGTPFSVAVVGSDFMGRYVASSTRHVFDRDGYRTEFTVSGQHDRSLFGLMGSSRSAGGAGGTGAGRVEGVMIGIVTGNKDPQDLGRVKIKLPTLHDAYESDWVRVVAPGAGKNTGLVFLPDVADEVLVAFEHGDIRRPYVLGGLWNSMDTPPLGKDLFDNGHNRRQGIVSRRNHRMVFFDDDQNLGMAVMTGDDKLRISLNATGTVIHVFADGKIQIEAKQDVEITSQQSITVEAQQQLTLKGNSGVKIQSGGQVEVAGSLIKLN